MTKKLLIALIAFSFLVGNFAFADVNPPGVRDYDTQVGASEVVANPLPLPSLKPTDEDCGFQDYTCEVWNRISTYGYGEYALDMMQRFSSTTNEGCYINEIGFIVYDLVGDLRITVYAEDPVYDDYPDDYDMDGGVLWTGVVAAGDLNLYPNFDYVGATHPDWPAGGITFDDGEDVFIAIEPASDPGTITLLFEDLLDVLGGACTFDEPWRSLCRWESATPGVYEPEHGFIVYSGDPLDFRNAIIIPDICCELPLYTCPGNQEWPTFQQNFGRTGYTTNTIGDLTNFRKLWEFQGDYFLVWGHPVIADEMVFVAFYDEIMALDLYTGALIWRTFTHADYAAFMQATTNNLRSTPTVADGKIYFGTGKATLNEGFVCADALTGDTIWVRHTGLGSGLPGGISGMTGEVQYATNVIVGNNVYFGTSFGMMYALDKNTGADVWDVLLDNGVWFSPATDGTDIFVGTSDGYLAAAPTVGGSVYKLDGATGATLYTWAGYDAAAEGFVTAPVYNADEDAVYVNGNLGVGVGSNGYFEGLLMKLAAADLTPIYGSWFLTMNPYFVTPNLSPFPWERLTVGGSHSAYWFYYGDASLASFKQFSLGGSATWAGDVSDEYNNGGTVYWETSTCSFASTCDPYLFAGFTIGDSWRIFNTQSGAELLRYNFSDDVLATAIAEYDDHDYVVVTTFGSAYGNTFGKVFCFDIGPDRPRLYIPEPVVTLPSVSFVDVYPASRFADIFGNSGSASMQYTLDPAKAGARVTNTSGLSKLAKTIKSDMLSEKVSMLDNRAYSATTDKNAYSELALALPTFVALPAGSETGTLAAGTMLNQEFILDPAQMLRGGNPFVLEFDTDDPDYNPEDASPYPHAAPQASITVVAVLGYDFCDGYINFGAAGANTAYVNNHGWNSANGPSDAFSIDGGASDGLLYHHSFFYGYEPHMAWLEEAGNSWNHFEPNSLCTFSAVSEDLYDATGASVAVSIDKFEASFIDSLKDQVTGAFDNANTPGLEMFITEYGGYDDAFANFKYIYLEIANRGSDPIPADLYWGTFSDWDVGTDVGVGMIDAGASAYRIYDTADPTHQFGMGSVPMLGNLYTDGSPTMGAYGTYMFANDPVVYDSYIVDSLFYYADNCPPYTDCYYPGTEVGVNPGQDMSAIIVGDKQFVDGDAVIKGGLVMFGFTDAGAPGDDVAGLMDFANKFAGFGRGDVNNDMVVNLLDLCALNCYVNDCGCTPYPFLYLGDVNADGNIDTDDVNYLFNYLFMGGPLPTGDWIVR